MRIHCLILGCFLAAIANSLVAAEPPRFTGPWQVDRLLDSSVAATFGEKKGLVQEVYYDSEPFSGQPTRVFAYYARPEPGEGPFPAMLLVHGGGGKAFPQWAELWAKRGYVALAMDLSGNGPDGKRLADGGPPLDDKVIRAIDDSQVPDHWTYHVVAAVLRGHALLAAQKEVDKNRIGITGISWGGYLTCIVAGIDDRLKAAVPIYGCGFLADNSCWQEEGRFAKLPQDARDRWVKLFDPSSYLPGVSCPIFFVNGTNDFAYPLDSYRKSYNLVTSPMTLRITVNMPHGHEAGWAPQEIGVFVDSVLKQEKPLISRAPICLTPTTAFSPLLTAAKPVKVEFHYTLDRGRWQQREWKTLPAHIEEQKLIADIPQDRPLVGFFTVTDDRGLVVSTDFEDFPKLESRP